MNTDSVEITKVDDQMAKLVKNNKIKFKDVTKERLSKLEQLSGLSKRVETKILEKEFETMNEKITQPDYYPTEEEIRRVASLEIYLEFLKDGIHPTDESIDQKVELVAFRAIKVKEEMKKGMDINRRAILAKLNGIVPLEKEEQEKIEGLIDEEAAKDEPEEVVENITPPVEEVAEEDLEEKIEDQYIDLDVSKEENLKTGLTEEEVQGVQGEAVEYADIDASEEETPAEEEEEKEESVEEEPVTTEKDDFDAEIEELLKESEDIKKRISEVADKKKAKEEEKAKAQKANDEAVHEKEMRNKALKEAIAKYREQLNKDKEKLENETKSLEEQEKGIQELDENTQAIKDQTKKMNKTIELLSGKLDGSEKTEEKSKKK